MSFFEEDAPTRRRTTPPRARRAAPSGPSDGGDQQTLLVRRATAVGIFVLFAVVLLFLVNSCRSTASENALKDYNRDVAEIATASQTQVGRQLFELLGGQGDSAPADLQTSVSSLRVEAENELDRAESLEVPEAMVPAHRSLLIALELRRDGLDFVAKRVRAALGNEGDAAEEATTAIAGQMQAFLASDVLYASRVRPLIQQAFDRKEIGGQEVARSSFVPDIAWLSPQVVAQRLGGGGGGGGNAGGRNDEAIAPGLHGTGLTSVSVGDTTLTEGGANRIASSGPPTFDVQFANQGESDEQDVRVDVAVSGGGGRAITGSDTVETIARGATATASVELPRVPPTGTALTIRVRVRPVPGEEKTDNNEQEYSALFETG